MKVKELIEKLQKLDQNLTVYVTCEDPDIVGLNNFVRPFVIEDVAVVEIDLTRDKDHRPEIAATSVGEGQKCATLEITSDF
ncbi:hypothetical protein PS718_00482 [Pseudomonas fluorescens]|uniref:Uncharacterized protein n=1 Tax=Pseudomonas fluorescens TaxID=294 RepID=A0A5E7A923_PSEFL|nr:hypothetical protein [Pseudomonas fluorescens]VVN71863.1 hypothetical protein PS718_00482 [Pseudomonas fluorescens]